MDTSPICNFMYFGTKTLTPDPYEHTPMGIISEKKFPKAAMRQLIEKKWFLYTGWKSAGINIPELQNQYLITWNRRDGLCGFSSLWHWWCFDLQRLLPRVCLLTMWLLAKLHKETIFSAMLPFLLGFVFVILGRCRHFSRVTSAPIFSRIGWPLPTLCSTFCTLPWQRVFWRLPCAKMWTVLSMIQMQNFQLRCPSIGWKPWTPGAPQIALSRW